MYNATNAFIIISSSSNIRHELGLDRPVPVSSTFNQIQFMISIKLLHVSAPGCHPQGVFLNKGIQVLKLWDFDTCHCLYFINLLTPNDDYSGRTAPLTSKCCILYIYSTNIGTECFKHGIYSPFFPLQNAVCFIILTYLVPVLFTFYIQVC